MTSIRLARRLGLDQNPLRRRTDKIAAGLAGLLVAVFLAGAPVLAAAAAGWADRAGATGQQAARSWRQVPAVPPRAAPAPAAWERSGYSWVPARRTAPDERPRAGKSPVTGGVAAGRTVPPRVDAAGSPAHPPPSHRAVLAREAAAAVVVIVALGAVLLCLAGAERWVLDRRRLAGWEAAWPRSAANGPSASGPAASMPAPHCPAQAADKPRRR